MEFNKQVPFMSRVTSLTSMSDKQLTRLIRLVVLLLVVGVVAFTAFYVVDRYHPIPKPSAIDTQIAADEAAVKANPADIAARGTLADLYVKAKRYQDAITQYQAIISAGQSLELAQMGLGRAYQGLSQLDDAAKAWQAVVDIAAPGEMAASDPNLATAYYELGLIATQQNRASDAVASLKKALAINNTDSDTLYALGLAQTAAGQLDDAIASLKAAAQFVPVGWADPYTALSTAYAKKGDAPMSTWASGMSQLATGDNAGAVAALTPLVSGPAAEDAMVGLGLAAESRGDTATAADWYQKALAKNPANPAATLGLARVRPIGSASAAPAASPASSQKVNP